MSRILSGSQLKIIALLCMTIDHIGATLPMDELPCLLLRSVGRTAFPLYAFLLSEGYTHTRNPFRYTASLLGAFILSEVPYDLLFHEAVWYPQSQCIMLTLTLGCLSMILWDTFRDCPALRLAAVAATALLGRYLCADYGIWGTVLPLMYHIVREHDGKTLLALFFVKDPRQSLASIPIALYNGRRGFIRGSWKWLFYLYYPLHLGALLLVKTFFF